MPLDFKHQLQKKDEILFGENKLFCASCHHWITSADWKIHMKEGHEHTVFNPAGAIYEIGCFRDAPGCWATGQASDDFTWFAGYKWHVALCEGCGKHLGWMFSGKSTPPVFFGLILNRLSDTIHLE
jgi:hypothetical protein